MLRTEKIFAKLEQCWLWDCVGQSEKALKVALEAHETASKMGELVLVAKASQYIAWFLRHLGRSSDGVDYIQEARRLWAEMDNQVEQARSNAIFSWLLLEFGDSDEAASVVAEAYSIAIRLNDNSLLAFVGNIYAISLNQTGDTETAIPIIEQSLGLARRLSDPHQLAGHLIDRGFIYSCMAERCKEAGDPKGMERALNNAMASNDEAITVARQHSDSWKLRIAFTNGADLHTKRGNFSAAEAYLVEWAQVPGKARGRLLREYDYARCELMIAAGRFEEARVLCEQSVALAIANGIPHQELSAIRKLSELYEAKGDYRSALESYKQYHAAYKKTAGDAVKRRVRLTALNDEIFNLKLQTEQLTSEAEIDSLTGIANRRKFDRELQHLIVIGGSFALALLDLDHFKSINDEFSHVIGDDVLRMVGNELRLICRESDLTARIGGEEFAILLPNTDFAKAENICERLRCKIAEFAWGNVAPGLSVTASIGLVMSNEAANLRALTSLADERLYAAKTAGRNCIVGLLGPRRIYSH